MVARTTLSVFAALLLLACSDSGSDAPGESTSEGTTGSGSGSTQGTSGLSEGGSGSTSGSTTDAAESSVGSTGVTNASSGSGESGSGSETTGGPAGCPPLGGDGTALAVNRIGETEPPAFQGSIDLIPAIAAIDGGVIVAAQTEESELSVDPLEPIPAISSFYVPRGVLARVDESGDFVWTRVFQSSGPETAFARIRDIDAGPGGTLFAGTARGAFEVDGASVPCLSLSFCAFFGWVDDDGGISGPYSLTGQQAPLLTHTAALPSTFAVAGSNNRPTSFGGPLLDNNTGNAGAGADVNIGVFDTEGQHVWSRRWGGVDTELLGGLDSTEDGDLVLVATTDGQVDFGGGVLGSGESPLPDIVIARLSGEDGEHGWSRALSATTEETSVDPRTQTRVVVQGETLFVSISGDEMSLSLDGRIVTASSFILALDVSTGDTLWHQAVDGEMAINGIDAQCSGLAVTGSYDGPLSYDGAAAPAPAGTDGIVLLVSPEDGSMQWMQTMTDATQDEAEQTGLDVAMGEDGNLWWSGEFFGDINLGTGLLQADMGGPTTDGFVARLDP